MSEIKNDSFVRVARTPVAITENFKLKGFIIGDLAGQGPGNKETLRNPYVQVSYKKLVPGAKEILHRHELTNREYVFVLNHPWGPISINGIDRGTVKPGEFTAIAGEKVFLDWQQRGNRISKVLVVKEPSVDDRVVAQPENMTQMEEDFIIGNFVNLARSQHGFVAGPEATETPLRTSKAEIYYGRVTFPLLLPQQNRKRKHYFWLLEDIWFVD